nr:GGDEF domain-containing protein [uncultured Actinoplanes sp.]
MTSVGSRWVLIGRRTTRPPLAVWYLLGGFGTMLAYFQVGDSGAVGQVLLYCLVSASAPAAMLYGTRRYRPRRAWCWLLLSAGMAVSTAADATFYTTHLVFHDERFPAPADVLYLSHYLVLAAGLVLLIRARTPQWQAATMIDAAIIAVAATLLYWIYLIGPIASGPAESTLTWLASVGYPVMDLVLLVVAARLVLGVGTRTPAFYLLCASLGLTLLSDTAYGLQQVAGIYEAGNFLDASWMLGMLAVGAAGLHPSMRAMSEPSAVATPDASPGRLAVLTVASLVAPGVLVHAAAGHRTVSLYVVGTASALIYLLVLARMAGLVRLQRLAAITDGLTGLRTRRFFEQAIADDINRAHRHGRDLAVLLLDVDHFKQVNDSYGHPGGDRVLCEIADRLRAVCRGRAVVARYGGEEFAVILTDTTSPAAAAFAEQLRRSVAAHPIAVNNRTHITVTVSIGLATLDRDTEAAALTLAADRALYQAKNNGRNQIATTPAQPHPAGNPAAGTLPTSPPVEPVTVP